ncbi:hypothetical protein GCM10010357_48270 [Streptomyces luteireticuli]|uniref:Uncharacterized protein n=1 Tax=Streptomyces luteireticuli TaxID=173858 RepID=A0ABN0YYY0_9ACTN
MNPEAPGHPRTLSRALIVGEARRIADEEGLAAPTVRRGARHRRGQPVKVARSAFLSTLPMRVTGRDLNWVMPRGS